MPINNAQPPASKQPRDRRWYAINAIDADTSEVSIYDFIGGYDGVSARQFVDELRKLSTPKINLRINSGGGDVFDSAAICTAISEHDAEITAHVEGIAASCASWIADSCDRVVIGKRAYMMVHPPMSCVMGNAEEMRKEGGRLDKLSNTIASIYADKVAKSGSGKTKDDVVAAMNAETWFDADEAVAWGLADEIKNDDREDEDGDEEGSEDPSNSLSRAVASLSPLLVQRFRNMPPRLKGLVNAGRPRREPQNKETPIMAKPIARDGKFYIQHESKEIEVEMPAPAPSPAPENKTAGKCEAEVTAAVNAATAKARDEAVKAEREYRTAFNTAAAAAALSGEALTNFEKKFYGLAIDQVKFLAENAIGARAKAVGEGSGETETEAQKSDAEKAAAEIKTFCAKRFANDASMRRRFKCNSTDPKDPGYAAALDRYVAVEAKCRGDEAKRPKSDEDDEEQSDQIGRLFKNKSLFTRVG